MLYGTKKGYYMHYQVDKDILEKLAINIENLTKIEKEAYNPEEHCQDKNTKDKCNLR